MTKLAIIGGGPAALMLAAQIDTAKYEVTLYEQKKTVGRKFLVAGEGGLNLTYNSSSLEELIACYYPRAFMAPIIRKFSNADLRKWLSTHGVPTFVGSSNRVFPDAALKPIEVLNSLVNFVLARGIKFQLGTKWIGWNEGGDLCFAGDKTIESDITVFATGGASWKVTGSDGKWNSPFEEQGIKILPFRAANCAFSVDWNKDFIHAHEGKPLKNIALTHHDQVVKGELVVSKFGLEGNAIYALSQKIQRTLLTEKNTLAYLDLKPSMTVDQIKHKYHRSRLSDVTSILKKDLNLDRTSIGILKQFSGRDTFLNPDLLAAMIKAVPVIVRAPAAIDEAISTLGGIDLNEVGNQFQLKKIPDTYAIGEMLDWFAPTGGYLLQGCFSMGFVLAEHLNEHFDKLSGGRGRGYKEG